MRSFLIALILATSGCATGADILDSLVWEKEFAVPSAGGIVGRSRVLIVNDWSSSDQNWNFAQSQVAGLFSTNPNMLLTCVFTKMDPEKPADPSIAFWNNQKNIYMMRLPHSTDVGGAFLRSFAGSEPGIMLVFDPEGRLQKLVHTYEIPSVIPTVSKDAENAWPLLPNEDQLPLIKDKHEGMAWFIAGDVPRCVADPAVAAPVGELIKKRLPVIVKKEIELLNKGGSPGRLLADDRLTRLTAEFPGTLTKDATKALAAFASDPLLKNEKAGMKAFRDYLSAMAKLPAAEGLKQRPKLLQTLADTTRGTYAAEVAKKIAEFSKIDLK